MGAKFQSDMIALGHTVVTGQRFVVVNHDDKLSGVDDDGEPIELELNTIVYISKEMSHKVFYGNAASVVKQKIKDNLPDITKEKINEALATN